MSEQNERGIRDMLKQVYEMWEKTATEQMEKLGRSQAFVAAMAQNLEQSLNISQRVKDITQSTLKMMNLPTQQDVAGLARQFKAMRGTLDEINEKLDKLAPPKAAKGKAKKARKSSKASS